MNTQNTPYSYPVRRARQSSFGWLPISLLLLLLSLLTGLVQLHTFYIYQTYQQGQCAITYGTTEYHSSKSGSYYTPDFQYTVSTKDGQQVDTGGYDAPYQQHYTQDEAQQVVNSYTVGQTYDCWYNPANPMHAVLVYRGYTIGNFISQYIGTTLGYLLGYGFLWYLFYYVFYRQLCLMRRGVLTEGQVVENFERRTRYGKRTYSRIFFSPLGDPSQSYKVEKQGAYMVGSLQPVCYDPVNPDNAQYGGRPGGCLAMASLLGFIVGALIAAAFLLSIWYGV